MPQYINLDLKQHSVKYCETYKANSILLILKPTDEVNVYTTRYFKLKTGTPKEYLSILLNNEGFDRYLVSNEFVNTKTTWDDLESHGQDFLYKIIP